MLKLIRIFGHGLIVNNRCYGRCYVKKIIHLCTFLKFHTHLQENSARLFESVFVQLFKGLKSSVFMKLNFS